MVTTGQCRALRSLLSVASCIWLMVTSVSARRTEKCSPHNPGVMVGRPNTATVLPDSSMAASSSRPGCPAHLARKDVDAGCGAWCPQQQPEPGGGALNSAHQWLQLDFGQITNVSCVETQGRFAGGSGTEFSSQYKLQYDRGDGRGFVWYVRPDEKGKSFASEFNGNSDTHSGKISMTQQLVAKSLRFIPYAALAADHGVCLRVEVYGCPADGVISYSMPSMPSQWDTMPVQDVLYDGLTQNKSESFHGGIGLLTDGLMAQPITVNLTSSAKQGSGWVGWPRQTNPVVLTFEFDTVRNFSSVRIHTNNQHNLGAQPFTRAVWRFSVGGIHYEGPAHTFPMRPTHKSAGFLPVLEMELSFNEAQCIGRFAKVELFHDASWLLISEVSFNSSAVDARVAFEDGPLATDVGLPVANDRDKIFPAEEQYTIAGLEPEIVLARNTTVTTPLGDTVPAASAEAAGGGLSGQTLAIIAGASAGGFALIVCLILALCLCRMKQKRRREHNDRPDSEADCKDTLYRDERRRQQIRPCTYDGFKHGVVIINGIEYSGLPQKDGIYEEPWGHCQSRQQASAPISSLPASRTGSIHNYAMTPDIGPHTGSMHLPCSNYLTGRMQMLPPPPPASYNEKPYCAELVNINIQGASGTSLCATSNQDLESNFINLEAAAVPQFRRQCLHFVEKLGEGQFGEVHLCEVGEVNNERPSPYGEVRHPHFVAIKVLRRNAGDSVRKDFQRELAIASQFKDPNISRVLGLFTNEEPPCAVFEYEEHGDLHQYLSRHGCPAMADPAAPALPFGCRGAGDAKGWPAASGLMSRGSLVYIACQVASGMKYLESIEVVHRDLAARNVLVGPLYSAKIIDVAMSRRQHASAYYRVGGKTMLPVRWMASESLQLGAFSSRSDVWSFGVLLWELFTFARQHPYAHWTDEQVVEQIARFARCVGQPVQAPPLSKPDYCPREVYDLMRECWNADDGSRPAFGEIHMFLTRKNVGYDPRQDRAPERSDSAIAIAGRINSTTARHQGASHGSLSSVG